MFTPEGAESDAKTAACRARGRSNTGGRAPGCGGGPSTPDSGRQAEATMAATSSRRFCAYRATPAGVQRTPSDATNAMR